MSEQIVSAEGTEKAERPEPRTWSSRSSLKRVRTRSQSRPRSPTYNLHRLYSRGFIDDHGNYVNDHDEPWGRTGVHDIDGTDAANEPHTEAVEEVEDPIDPDRDLERGEPLKKQKSATDKEKDPNMVSFGPKDPDNPKEWANSRKWAAVLVVSSFTFISPVSSSMIAPALESLSQDLGVKHESVSAMLLSIFLLAYAVGPLFLGPMSEVYGRVPVLQLSNLFFLVFNIACGFAHTQSEMLAFRFLAGLGGSAPLAIGGGILADCFIPEQRGKAIGVYSLAPLIGPAIGPIAGGFIDQHVSWRWIFWSVSIADVVVQLFGLFFLQETWAPILLERKVRRLRLSTGNQNLYSSLSRNETMLHKLRTSLIRPVRMLFTQPTIQVMALYMSYLYGLIYLVISSFPRLFHSKFYYNQTIQSSGLHYIAIAIGYFIGAQFTSRFNDWLYQHLKKRNFGVGKPEFRIPATIPCAILLPAGLFWYGWSAEARLHWIMPDIGAAMVSAGMIAGYYSIQNYVIDCYTKYAASAVAAITMLRSMAGFGFPLFADLMYEKLGYGWGNSVLGFVAIAIGVPAPWLMWNFGAKLRARSGYARDG
ncbi:MFS general substrate transporter [Piedraia hortae CBS 480.64]|uniref:Cercosporin MFS transporter CTB4 n=1 Tax=Piedraia hortae CBS 480.64 TaxID=1314780 RepID=A0A6A7BUI0_9PEZI|nr:MFS general substrate transporter [Piedraia hortae CBS 480.64]